MYLLLFVDSNLRNVINAKTETTKIVNQPNPICKIEKSLPVKLV